MSIDEANEQNPCAILIHVLIRVLIVKRIAGCTENQGC